MLEAVGPGRGRTLRPLRSLAPTPAQAKSPTVRRRPVRDCPWNTSALPPRGELPSGYRRRCGAQPRIRDEDAAHARSRVPRLGTRLRCTARHRPGDLIVEAPLFEAHRLGVRYSVGSPAPLKAPWPYTPVRGEESTGIRLTITLSLSTLEIVGRAAAHVGVSEPLFLIGSAGSRGSSKGPTWIRPSSRTPFARTSARW
jgi:hypothetical protein